MEQADGGRWENAEKYLKVIEEAYQEIGLPGAYGLAMAIIPLKERFEAGERTEELYEAIMELE